MGVKKEETRVEIRKRSDIYRETKSEEAISRHAILRLAVTNSGSILGPRPCCSIYSHLKSE